MNSKKLRKLKRKIAEMRRSPQKATAIARVAEQLGRKRVNRGKEPVWQSYEFDDLYPLSIPHHPSRDLAPGTQNSILNQLEEDVLAWELRLEDEIDSEDGSENDGNDRETG